MTQRYKIIIEYDGTNYHGWQQQKGLPTVEEKITHAFFKVIGEKIKIFAAGRTDAGVHAKEQVAHLDLEDAIAKKISPYKLQCALNYYLKDELISITNANSTTLDFHSRFSAKSRHYRYFIVNRYAKLSLLQNKAWLVHRKLNVDAMKEAILYFIGNHDFTSFRDKLCQANSPIKTLDSAHIEINNSLNEVMEFHFTSRSFLHHQVRNMVGTLYLVGKEKIRPKQILDIIEAKDRKAAGPQAPACGLYLWQITY